MTSPRALWFVFLTVEMRKDKSTRYMNHLHMCTFPFTCWKKSRYEQLKSENVKNGARHFRIFYTSIWMCSKSLVCPPPAAAGIYWAHLKAAREGTGNESSVMDTLSSEQTVSFCRLKHLFRWCALCLNEKVIKQTITNGRQVVEKVAATTVMWLKWRYWYLGVPS